MTSSNSLNADNSVSNSLKAFINQYISGSSRKTWALAEHRAR